MKTVKQPNNEYRQMKQTLTILRLLSSGAQTAAALTRTLDLHERTVDRIMRALADGLGPDTLHQRSVPGSGKPPRWSLDEAKRACLEDFFAPSR